MKNTSYADYIRHWGQLDSRIRANPALAAYEPQRAQLEGERLGLVDSTNRQAALKAETQAVSREVDGHVGRGRELATRLRDAIRAQFGREDEKLTEFGMSPRRPSKPAAPLPVESKKPPEPGPNPAQTAAPGTDASTKGVNAV